MRYYRLEIVKPDGSTPMDSAGNYIGPFDTTENPRSGLHIEFDAYIAGQDTVNGGTMIAIYGLPISMLNQSVQLSGYHLYLYAGFTSGLPLENPAHQGLVISGQILNCYANFLGVNQTLNLTVNPSPLMKDEGQRFSISLSGIKGEKLSDVLQHAIAAAYPNYTVRIDISDSLILAEDSHGVYTNIGQLATAVRDFSIGMMNQPKYSGVRIVLQSGVIRVFDNLTETDGAIDILPEELIGQPTWIDVNTISFKCPMRADLHAGDTVHLPDNLVSGSPLAVNTEQSAKWIRNQINFNGDCLIISVRHVGQYLNADGNNAWVTIYEATGTGEE
ncbi:hypothetical protein [Citrobacter arsenatis]|uniref:hypothetical protein n=1 Tax=Citrobacter arsenatis TaxID=2546350 RepID=UPI00300E624A